jgi:GT2 family glycosyltransferase
MIFDSWPEERFDFLGNNMVIKKQVIKRVGLFKTWLGVGSISNAAEEDELTYRVLKNGHKILYDPGIAVYHDRWLCKDDYDKLMKRYSVGYFAAFTFHFLKGDKDAFRNLLVFLRMWYKGLTSHVSKSLRPTNIRRISRVVLGFSDFFYFLKGILIGMFYSMKGN